MVGGGLVGGRVFFKKSFSFSQVFQQFWQGLQLVSIQLYYLKCICRISNWLVEKSVWSEIPLFLDFSFLLFKVCEGLFIASVPRSGNTMTLGLFSL